jgi:hypothetical protein
MESLGWRQRRGSSPAARRGARQRAGLRAVSASNTLSCKRETLHPKPHSKKSLDSDLGIYRTLVGLKRSLVDRTWRVAEGCFLQSAVRPSSITPATLRRTNHRTKEFHQWIRSKRPRKIRSIHAIAGADRKNARDSLDKGHQSALAENRLKFIDRRPVVRISTRSWDLHARHDTLLLR